MTCLQARDCMVSKKRWLLQCNSEHDMLLSTFTCLSVYACMHVWMYECMFVCMYVCMHARHNMLRSQTTLISRGEKLLGVVGTQQKWYSCAKVFKQGWKISPWIFSRQTLVKHQYLLDPALLYHLWRLVSENVCQGHICNLVKRGQILKKCSNKKLRSWWANSM